MHVVVHSSRHVIQSLDHPISTGFTNATCGHGISTLIKQPLWSREMIRQQWVSVTDPTYTPVHGVLYIYSSTRSTLSDCVSAAAVVPNGPSTFPVSPPLFTWPQTTLIQPHTVSVSLKGIGPHKPQGPSPDPRVGTAASSRPAFPQVAPLPLTAKSEEKNEHSCWPLPG